MICVRSLAKYVIKYCNDGNKPITNLKLQKILYYIAGVYAGVNEKPLFAENFEAWPYGPVIRSIYIEYCSYGSLPLIVNGDVSLESNEPKELIDFTIRLKENLTDRQLVRDSHREQPWLNHKEDVDNKPYISFEELKNYFKNSDEVNKWMTREIKN